ncbi:hypothetical protein [Desulfomicrobium escambiense]|uniref:hypothetical protein n=1 Tax=Desulfomicrobium escambiense TaxID=29503 RepID=UPI0003F554A9|nr:hypothetical protein [Desulfomicrobium escambiense]
MPTITTPYGPVEALPGAEFHPDGSVRSCIPAIACPLITPLGVLVPQFTANTQRKRHLPAMLFYPGGRLRNLPLEEQTVVPTPLGLLPAEQVTFFESGALKRLFPLNGTLSGFWTQEDEAALAAPLALDTPLGPVETAVISLNFSGQGGLRSLTLWPSRTLEVPCPLGAVTARIGVSFYDSGAIRSLEPAAPTAVTTALGPLMAFDADAVGISGDSNSLRFRENGSLLGLVTAAHAFDVVQENGRVRRIEPPLRRNPCDGQSLEVGPLALEFASGRVSIGRPGQPKISAAVTDVTAVPFHQPLPSMQRLCTMGAGAW